MQRTHMGLGVLLLLVLAVLSEARHPHPHRPPHKDPGPSDQLAAASGGHHHGRVQIKVYRGPDHDHHAPYGYWVKQPADDAPHH